MFSKIMLSLMIMGFAISNSSFAAMDLAGALGFVNSMYKKAGLPVPTPQDGRYDAYVHEVQQVMSSETGITETQALAYLYNQKSELEKYVASKYSDPNDINKALQHVLLHGENDELLEKHMNEPELSITDPDTPVTASGQNSDVEITAEPDPAVQDKTDQELMEYYYSKVDGIDPPAEGTEDYAAEMEWIRTAGRAAGAEAIALDYLNTKKENLAAESETVAETPTPETTTQEVATGTGCKIKVSSGSYGSAINISMEAGDCLDSCRAYYLADSNYEDFKSKWGYMCFDGSGLELGGAAGTPDELEDLYKTAATFRTTDHADLVYTREDNDREITFVNILARSTVRSNDSRFSGQRQNTLKGDVEGLGNNIVKKLLGNFCVDASNSDEPCIGSETNARVCGSRRYGKNSGTIICKPVPEFPMYVLKVSDSEGEESTILGVKGDMDEIQTIFRIDQVEYEPKYTVVHNDRWQSSLVQRNRGGAFYGENFRCYGRLPVPPGITFVTEDSKLQLKVNCVNQFRNKTVEERNNADWQNAGVAKDLRLLLKGEVKKGHARKYHPVQFILDKEGDEYILINIDGNAELKRSSRFRRIYDYLDEYKVNSGTSTGSGD